MRARNIKPAFFKSDQLARCSFAARLLFVGLWCLADREGRLEDRPRIKMEVFPGDEVDCESLLDELQGQGLIRRYEARGLACIHIPRFHAHQKPHHNEAASQLPPPPKPGGKRLRIVVASASHHGRKSFGLRGQGVAPSDTRACSTGAMACSGQGGPPSEEGQTHNNSNTVDGYPGGDASAYRPGNRDDQRASDHGSKPFGPGGQPLGPDCGMRNEDSGMRNEEGGGSPSSSGEGSGASPAGEALQCPHGEIIGLYHEELPELPRVRAWKETSRRNLRARWRESGERQSLSWWRWFFRECIRGSDFLMGRKTDFVATLSWMVQPRNFEKILNGQYANFGPATGSRLGDKNARACSLFVQSEASGGNDGAK